MSRHNGFCNLVSKRRIDFQKFRGPGRFCISRYLGRPRISSTLLKDPAAPTLTYCFSSSSLLQLRHLTLCMAEPRQLEAWLGSSLDRTWSWVTVAGYEAANLGSSVLRPMLFPCSLGALICPFNFLAALWCSLSAPWCVFLLLYYSFASHCLLHINFPFPGSSLSILRPCKLNGTNVSFEFLFGSWPYSLCRYSLGFTISPTSRKFYIRSL